MKIIIAFVVIWIIVWINVWKYSVAKYYLYCVCSSKILQIYKYIILHISILLKEELIELTFKQTDMRGGLDMLVESTHTRRHHKQTDEYPLGLYRNVW